MELEQPLNAYVCQYCKGSFDKLENLDKHVQKIHTVSSSGKENRVCPLCGTQCIKIEGYRNHLRHIHGHNEEGQVVLFKSFNDFLVWKNELEKRNYCKYVMQCLPKKISSNDKVHIYRCDSSAGSMKEKKSGVAVKESCPAVITATESAKTKGVKIEHWNTHVGHIIPVEEDDLDAALGALGTTEIILTSDQRYQYEGQTSDGNLFFITESNDGSLSETFVQEEPTKSSNLFPNSKNKVSDSFSKLTSQKFSYKKDPTKKSGSFNYSLASVACMKSSAKKKIVAPPPVTTSSVADEPSTTVTKSDVLLPKPTSSVASSEVELATESINNIMNSVISSNIDMPSTSKEGEIQVTLESPSETIPIANTSAITSQTFEFINDGSLSGQVVLLNSLPGQNSNQNVTLCSDQKFISIGPAINVETVSAKKGKASKKSQQNNASEIIIISPAPETKNVSSVQDKLNLSQNPVPRETVLRSPGPSILKKAKKSNQKTLKKNVPSTRKNITFAPNNGISPVKKIISAEQKLGLGLNPSLDVTVIDAVESTQSITNKFSENVKVVNSVPLEICNSTPTTSSTNINLVSNIQVAATTTSALIASNTVSPAIKNSVPSSISNIQHSNPILLNSFPPGQTFMSINNNLIPIGAPSAPLLPSNFSPGIVLTSPVLPSPVTRPVRPKTTPSRSTAKNRMSNSCLASRPPASSSTPIVSSDKKSQNKLTNIGTATTIGISPHTSTVPLLLIPNSGNQVRPSVSFSSPLVSSSVNSTLSSSIRPNITQPIISSSLISGGICSVLPRPIISNNGSPVFTQVSPGTQLIPTPISNIPTPLLTNNGKQIRPILENVPLLTSTGQQVSKAILQNVSIAPPLIGQPAIAPRPFVSTTISNTIKVQKVQLPFSKTTVSPSVALTSVSSSLSESSKVNSVALNTEPISSAPAISIPSLACLGPHKPGSLIFESQGDMYMLEPVEENVQISNTNSVKNILNKVNIAVPYENTKAGKSDEVKESAFEDNKAKLASHQKEKSVESQIFVDTKVDSKVKSLSSKKNADIKNSVQIKSIVQEKRPIKDDDVEILKKVKYYQMEMRYLASQAECKRLRLELAKAQISSKETVKSNKDLLYGETSMEEIVDGDALQIDRASDKNNLGLKQTFTVSTENMTMDIDRDAHEVNDKITKDKSIDGQADLTNKCDAVSDYSDHGSEICVESGDSNCDDNSSVDSENSNHSDIVLSSKTNQAKYILDNQNINHSLKSVNCDIESNKGNNLGIQKEACKTLHVTQRNKTLANNSNNFNPSDKIFKTDSNEESADTNASELTNEESMDIRESEEGFKDTMEDSQTINDCKTANQFKVQELRNETMHASNKERSARSNLKNMKHQNNSSFELEKKNPSCDNSEFQETFLKKLEFQYGKRESSDIYTMIRTSVLRSLYEDMKTLCEENRKLYDKLENCSSQDKSYDIDKLHSEKQ